jgi:hypothetical protein
MRDFKPKLQNQIETDNISTLFGFDKDMTAPVLRRSEEILKPYIKKRMGQIIDGVPMNPISDTVVGERNKLIQAFDQLNFIIETSHDGSITNNGDTYNSISFTGYTYDLLYDKYSDVVSYINTNEPQFYEDLDTTSYIFNINTTMTTSNLSKFLSEMLNSDEEKKAILDLYKKDPAVFTTRIYNNIEKRLNNFMTDVPSDKEFKSIEKNKPKRKDDTAIEFGIDNFDYEFTADEKTKLKSTLTTSINNTTSTLNYYRDGKSVL